MALRSPEMVAADDEIDASSRDETDDVMLALQDAIAARATFVDLWRKRNNLPAPPCPCQIEQELATRDLVAEETMRVISRQVITARKSRKVELHVLSTRAQLNLL